MSALTRSRRSLLGTCSEAIQTGVPVDSKRRRSCSRPSTSVRYVARTESSGALDCWDRTVPKTTSPTPSAAATATRTIAVLMRLVRRELPALVHVPGPDAGGRRNVRTFVVGRRRHVCVVRVRLARVLHRRSDQEPDAAL